MSRSVLVSYASVSGSTAEVAEAIGRVIAEAGVLVQVRSADDVTDLSGFRAVVLGSSIRAGRWLPGAVAFIQRHEEALSRLPVAYFTTCLTMAEDSEAARRKVLAYLQPVLDMGPEELEPVGLGLFAGSLDPERQLITPASGGPYGDYRDWDKIRAWAAAIRPRLLAGSAQAAHPPIIDEALLLESDLPPAESQPPEEPTAAPPAAGFERVNLIGADLSRAELQDADFAYAILNGANLSRANLCDADLRHADLHWADLSRADLRGADMRHARLGWANLSHARLDDANLRKAHYNYRTQWPEGFSPDEAGCIRHYH